MAKYFLWTIRTSFFNLINTMGSGGLAAYGAKASTAMILA